jgi:hypothetical protein
MLAMPVKENDCFPLVVMIGPANKILMVYHFIRTHFFNFISEVFVNEIDTAPWMCLMFIDEHARCVKSGLLFCNEMIILN